MTEDEGIGVLFLSVSERLFAVDVGQVEALRRKETLYPARNGPPGLQGFLPMGQAIIPVLDLAVRLGLQEEVTRKMGFLIVTAEPKTPLAFQVDMIEGPKAVAWNRISLLPDTLQRLQDPLIVWGLVWGEAGLVPLLDLDQIVPSEEITILKQIAQEYQGGRYG
jgi:chemotaxis signal transduction protein